jgi:hypothetical protein
MSYRVIKLALWEPSVEDLTAIENVRPVTLRGNILQTWPTIPVNQTRTFAMATPLVMLSPDA